MPDQCSACKYWHENPKVNSMVISSTPTRANGTCLRYPPVTIILATARGLGNATMMPSTDEDQLCGEFVAGTCIIPPKKKDDEELPKSKLLT